MEKMNRQESCYQKAGNQVTLFSPVEAGKPIRMPVRVKMKDGSEKTISRREDKKWRKGRKAAG